MVSHSGVSTIVKSPPLVIDTSPPKISLLYVFNPEFSKDIEVTDLGNNHTVGVTWEFTEDISIVTKVSHVVFCYTYIHSSKKEVYVSF